MDTCRRCRRPLRSATSRDLGYGRTCLRKIKASLAKAAQLDNAGRLSKALDLITDGAIVPMKIGTKNTIFRAVSSNGRDRYLVAPNTCNCPAGRASRTCYHQVAATILAA